METQTIELPDTLTVTDALPELSLEPTDGCDRCGYEQHDSELTGLTSFIHCAQALVAVQLASGDVLYFCGHHYRKHEAALATVAVKVLDKRDTINEKPASGSVHAG